MGHWEWGGQGVNTNCHSDGQTYTNTSEAEPFFEQTNANYPCYYMAIRINGQLYGGSPYGYLPGSEFKRYIPDKSDTYDCINGDCLNATQYNTPGIYQSLADCQAVCANGGACAAGKQCVDPTTFCPTGKVCIDQDEYRNIQGLIAKINSEVC